MKQEPYYDYFRAYLHAVSDNVKDLEDIHSGDTVYGYYANWNGPVRKMGTVADTCRHTVEFVENYPELAKKYPRSWGLFKKNPDDDEFIIYLDENDQLDSGTYTTDNLHGLIVFKDDSVYEDALRFYELDKAQEERINKMNEINKKQKDNEMNKEQEDDEMIDLTDDSDVDDLIEYMLDILCYEQGCDDARDNEDLLEELVYPLYSKWAKSQPDQLLKSEAEDSLKEFISKPSILRKVWKYVDDEE